MKKLVFIFVVFVFAACQSANNDQNSENEESVNIEFVETTINVGGMHCDMCVSSIEKGINELEGISFVKASLNDSTAIVKYDASKTDLAHIEKVIEKRGYSIKNDL